MRNGKRIYASAFKAWLVEQACMPGASVSGLATRHGVNANLLRHWMRLSTVVVLRLLPSCCL